VLLQFFWWATHIISLTQEINNNPAYISKRITMIIGEASVFVLFIGLGAYYVIKSYYKELNLAKKQKNFTLSVTHELKTPIASTKLFAETLLNRENITEDKKRIALEKIVQDQDRLQQLVDKILLVSSIEEGEFRLYKKPVDLKKLIDSILIKKVKSKHQLLNKVAYGQIVYGDEFYIVSIAQNLLDNALKYSSEGTEITFSSEQNSNNIILRITDQGIGVPDEEKQRIFERFYRIEKEETRKTKGTGLGLFLVKELVRLHESKIICRDNKPNGTIFEIQFKKINE